MLMYNNTNNLTLIIYFIVLYYYVNIVKQNVRMTALIMVVVSMSKRGEITIRR